MSVADGIVLEDGAKEGRYVYRAAGVEAELVFGRVGERLIIEHTGVPDAMRGMGVGQALMLRAVEDARAARRRILPVCPFAAAQFRRHPEWADVLDTREAPQDQG